MINSSPTGCEPLHRVLIIRHDAAAKRTAKRLDEKSIAHHTLSISAIVPFENAFPDMQLDALIFTSSVAAEVFRNRIKDFPTQLKDKPIFCVGEHTAELIKEAGFSGPTIIAPDAKSLAQKALEDSANQTFLYFCAKERAFDMRSTLNGGGKTCSNLEIYENRLLTPTITDMRNAISHCNSLLLYSARTTAHFFALVDKYALVQELVGTKFVAISPNVAGKIPAIHSSNIHIADRKTEAAMLKCLQRLQ